jgi:LPXTG-motif cell wall-anchored protein
VSTDASEHAAHEDSGNSVLGLVVAAAVLVIGAAVWIVRRRRA